MRTRIIGIAAVALAAALSVAGCSSSHGNILGGNPGNGTGNNNGGGNGAGPANIKDSKFFGLTTLTDSQLCGTMSTSEASGIIGKTTDAGKFTNTLGLGIICEWQVGGDDTDELYVGVSTILDWKAAQAIGALLKPTTFTIDGHPALGADAGGINDYATVDVAVGAAHDPAVEFRAPTLDQAKAVATLVLPRLIALGG